MSSNPTPTPQQQQTTYTPTTTHPARKDSLPHHRARLSRKQHEKPLQRLRLQLFDNENVLYAALVQQGGVVPARAGDV
ncbi:hypothetical protein A1F95_09634, partial [Pyrenophora tritici-repentis]